MVNNSLRCLLLSYINILAHYVKIRRHPQNWKYITYCIVVRGGPSHSQMLRVQKIS